MTPVENTILAGLAYVLVGITLVGYDMSAPLLERKMYVMQKDVMVGFITWFVWPATVVFEALQDRQLHRNYWRFLIGVAALALAAASGLQHTRMHELEPKSVVEEALTESLQLDAVEAAATTVLPPE